MLVLISGHLGRNLGHLGGNLGHLGRNLGHLGRNLGHLSRNLGHLGRNLGLLNRNLGHLGRNLGHCVQICGKTFNGYNGAKTWLPKEWAWYAKPSWGVPSGQTRSSLPNTKEGPAPVGPGPRDRPSDSGVRAVSRPPIALGECSGGPHRIPNRIAPPKRPIEPPPQTVPPRARRFSFRRVEDLTRFGGA